MNESDETLRYLEAVCRPRPQARPLYCPKCGSHGKLDGCPPEYRCICGFTFASLAALVTEPPSQLR